MTRWAPIVATSCAAWAQIARTILGWPDACGRPRSGRILTFLKRWWDKEPRQTLSLLAPDVLCEIQIHVLPNGDRKMFCSKLPQEIPVNTLAHITLSVTQSGLDFVGQYASQIPQQALGQLTQHMVQNALNFGKQHGIELTFQQGGKP